MMHWNPPQWVPLTNFFFQIFFQTKIFFSGTKIFFQGTTCVQFFMYCKAKKKFGMIRNFLKLFIFENLHRKDWLWPYCVISQTFQNHFGFYIRFWVENIISDHPSASTQHWNNAQRHVLYSHFGNGVHKRAISIT